MTDDEKNRMLQYRKEHFAVQVGPDRDSFIFESGQVVLRVTHNGFQWNSVSLLKSEIPKVIEALNAHC